jgi:hypothetical protein
MGFEKDPITPDSDWEITAPFTGDGDDEDDYGADDEGYEYEESEDVE